MSPYELGGPPPLLVLLPIVPRLRKEAVEEDEAADEAEETDNEVDGVAEAPTLPDMDEDDG